MNHLLLEKIQWRWSSWQELSRDDTVAMLQLRSQVFVVEQNCPYLDIDGKDPLALHLIGWLDGKVVATCRLFPEFAEYDGAVSIGRVCCSEDLRRYGIGRELMQQAVDYADRHFPGRQIVIGAQHYLKRFYERYGFVQSSQPYDEDGIEHIHMRREPQLVVAALQAKQRLS